MGCPQSPFIPNWKLGHDPAWLGPMPEGPADVWGLLVWRRPGATNEDLPLIQMFDPSGDPYLRDSRLSVIRAIVAFRRAPENVELQVYEAQSNLRAQPVQVRAQPNGMAIFDYPVTMSWVWQAFGPIPATWTLSARAAQNGVTQPDVEIEWAFLICHVSIAPP